VLARLGFTATAVDLALHGERTDAGTLEPELITDFIGCIRRIVYNTADDISALIDYWNEPSPVGLYAVSLGGLTAHLLAVSEHRISAITAMLTSPDWTTADPNLQAEAGSHLFATLTNESPVNSPTAYPPIALLMLVGDEDTVVTPDGSKLLYERLLPLYSTLGISDRLCLKIYPGLGHVCTPEMFDMASIWLQTHLFAV
jgi:alpha-beta hydrolase superfamily lysophospholipase